MSAASIAGAAWAAEPGAAERRAAAGPEAPVALDHAVAAATMLADARGRLEHAARGLGEAQREAILGFYGERAYAPFWTVDGRAEVLLAALGDSGRHGLPVGRYDPQRLELLVADVDDPDGVARAEIGLMRAYLRYAGDLAGGVLSPRQVDSEINLTPARPGPEAQLARLEGGPVAEALEALAPQAPEYHALIAEKARLEALAAGDGWGEPVPDGRALREGDRDPRVAALRGRLARLGYEVPGEGEGFDRDLAEVLEAFQRDFGLHDDGILGAQTLAALNASPADRIGQILVNLERIRWLPEDLGDRHVWVNIPDYTVSVFEGGERVYHTRSIVGQARETRTPEFSDKMTYLVVNPTWYIPDSIAKRVYLPKLRQDPSVLRRSNMRLFTRAGTEIDPGLVDFASLGGEFPFRVRQNPSPGNALGRVKFMFPNQFSIYLHDTPDRHLFGRDARAFSNGCVRLEDPFELAHYLLAPQLDDPERTFQAWVDAGREHYVTLEEPIAVHIVYRTAWVDAEAGLQLRDDVYGRDRRVLEALAALGVAMPGT